MSCHDHERQNRNLGLQGHYTLFDQQLLPRVRMHAMCRISKGSKDDDGIFMHFHSATELWNGSRRRRRPTVADGKDTEADRRKVQLQHAARRICHMWRKRGMAADRDQISNSNFTPSGSRCLLMDLGFRLAFG